MKNMKLKHTISFLCYLLYMIGFMNQKPKYNQIKTKVFQTIINWQQFDFYID